MELWNDYRALHRIPELGHHLPETTYYIEKRLAGLSCRVFSPAEGSLAAYFDFGKPVTLAFRADTDALPIQETTGLPFASCHPGRMHACGHDGHTAICLELARRLHKSGAACNCLLLFQCAEETDGGAKDICRSGALDGCHGVLGLHLWPELPMGQVFSRRGPMMAGSCPITFRLAGAGRHIAQPGQGDPLAACLRLYRRARRLGVRFGQLHCGTAPNCVSADAFLQGSLRCFSPRRLAEKKKALRRLAAQSKAGVEITLELGKGYPPLVNHTGLYRAAAQVFPLAQLPRKTLAAEDFAFYGQKKPSLFCFLGAGNVPPLHSGRFFVPEAALRAGADFFTSLATSDPFCRAVAGL